MHPRAIPPPHDAQLDALRFRAHHLCEAATAHLASASGDRVAFEGPAWNGNTVPLIAAARAHCLLAVQDSFVAAVRGTAGVGGGVPAAMEALARLHGLVLLEQGAADLLEAGFIDGAQLQAIKGALYKTLMEVRPNAVAYVDGFGLTDYLLNSALGREVCASAMHFNAFYAPVHAGWGRVPCAV